VSGWWDSLGIAAGVIAPAGDVSDDDGDNEEGGSQDDSGGEEDDDEEGPMGFSVKDMVSMRHTLEQEEDELSEDEGAAEHADDADRVATLRDDPDGAMFVRPGVDAPTGAGTDWMSGLDSESSDDDEEADAELAKRARQSAKGKARAAAAAAAGLDPNERGGSALVAAPIALPSTSSARTSGSGPVVLEDEEGDAEMDEVRQA